MRKYLSFFLIGLLSLFWAVPGFATTLSTTPASDDMILSILAHTVGPVVHKISGVGTGTVSDITLMLKDINELILIAGGLLLTYTVFTSIMRTAHEGEAMGQKWSSMWIPFKAAAGAALILPVPSLGGLSAAQGIVIWLLTFGIGAADGLWAQTIGYIAKDPVGSVVVSPIHTGQMAEGIIDSQVCEQAMNATADSWWKGSNPISRVGPKAENTLNPLDGAVHMFEGYQEADQPLPGGKVYATRYSEYDWTADGGGLLGKLTSMGFLPSACGKIAYTSGAEGNGVGATMVNSIGSANGSAINTLITSLKPVSTNLYDEKKTGTNDANFIKAINAYDDTMQKAIETAADTAIQPEVQQYVNAAKEDGFATAGEWFWDIVQWNSIGQKAANSLGDATGLDFGNAFGKLGSSKLRNAEARAASFEKENGSLVGHIQPSRNFDSMTGGIMGEATSLFVSGIANFNTSSGDPLIAIRNLGNGMEIAGGTIYALQAGLIGAVGAANGGIDKLTPVVGNATNAAAYIVKYEETPVMLFIGGLLLIEGFFISFVVPLIPFTIWVFGLLGFLLMAFEMIVSAPLWAILHMHPESHEVVGMGGQGYKLAFAIITRPFLMVVGLIGGYALFMGFSALITPMISKAIVSGQDANGGFLGPLDIIGAGGVYVVLMTILAYECFKLVILLPERVMAWASVSHQGYGEQGGADKMKGAHEGAKGKAGQGATAFESGGTHKQGASGGWARGIKRN